jgi:hypothetical protein
MRMEVEFDFSIPNQDAQAMETVGQTVRYLWRRSCEQGFALRDRSEDVCPRAFVFYEVRRLLIVRGGVSRRAVRLDARLGDLLPTWYPHFWKQIQDIFQISLPQKGIFDFNRRIEKRMRVRELINLLISSRTLI